MSFVIRNNEMGEFQRSPSKVWWGNEYSSPVSNRINFQQWRQQNDDKLYHEENVEDEETRIYKSSQITTNNELLRDEAITRFNESTSSPKTNPRVNENQSETNTTSDDSNNNDWLNRKSSGSPNSHKSQDSGFSDSETSPIIIPNDNSSYEKESSVCHNDIKIEQRTPLKSSPLNAEIFFKDSNSLNYTPMKNLNINCNEKYSPKQCIASLINAETNKNPQFRKFHSVPTTPEQITSKNFQLSRSLQPTLLIYPNQQQIIPNNSPKMDTAKNYQIALSPTMSHNRGYSYGQEITNKINYHRNTSTMSSPLSVKSKSENSKTRNRTRSRSTPRSSPRTSPKVNRNLFSCLPASNGNSVEDITKLNGNNNWLPQKILGNISGDPNENTSSPLNHSPKLSYTVPISRTIERQIPNRLNVTAPAGDELKYDPNEISFEDDTHCTMNGNIFQQTKSDTTIMDNATTYTIDNIESPVYHSTPKNNIFNQRGIVDNHMGAVAGGLQKKIFNNILENKKAANKNLIEDVKTSAAPPVAKWLEELSRLYEAECMVTLQSKSLAADLSRQVAEAATKATVILKSFLSHSKIIYSDFYTILKQLTNNKVEHLGPLIQSLNGNITEFILTYVVNCQANFLTKTEQRGQDVQEILQLCDFLRTASSSDCSLEELESTVQKLKYLFRDVERGLLAIQIQLLVNMIEEPTTELALRGAVQGVTWVSTQQNPVASTFLIRCGAPRALLTVCLESKASTLRAAALRALATICSTTEAVRQIEHAGGIEIIADILSEDSRPEPELSEAVAVIAQITAPWIEDNHTLIGLKENAKSLITSLTRFLETSQCCQNLLLCAAALANISSMEPSTVWPLLQCRTAEKLLVAVQKRGPNISVFLKEQVATLLSNMSAANESRLQLGEAKAVVALLCFLQVPHFIFNESKSSEQAAALRLQQKAAVALSRLCNERSISQQVVELGAVNQLVRLCKEKKERSHSDAILVACLAALRKIVSNCGNHVISEQDAMELVEPRLLDSFLTYSSQNESYV